MRLTQVLMILACGVILAGAAPAYAEDVPAVVNGVPFKKVTSNMEGAQLVPLKDAERLSYRLIITKKDNKYFWASKDDKELIFTKRGDFYDFVEPNGKGYIRVTNVKDKCMYMEHLILGFMTITYWGIGEQCSLK